MSHQTFNFQHSVRVHMSRHCSTSNRTPGPRQQVHRRLVSVAGCALLLVLAAAPAHSQSLHDALEMAWERQPAARAQGLRSAELAARAKAADAWLPSPPSMVIGARSDRLNGNNGAREYEAELGIPLWLPGQRERESGLVQAQQSLQRESLANAKWKLAGEVREAFLQAKAAQVESAAAQRRVDDAVALAADVERRYKAGDLARTDFNLARSAELAARAAAGDAQLRSLQASQAFLVLTGVSIVPLADETPAASPPALPEHPALRHLQKVAEAADAQLRLAALTRRDNPELILGYRHDRSTRSDDYAGTTLLALRIPFATEARNEPRMAAANAELIEASAALDNERRRIEAEIGAAQAALQQAGMALELAAQRQRLATDNDSLLGKAFELGEIDLATRLRTVAERHAADAELARARLESQRAVSRLNQALGVLP